MSHEAELELLLDMSPEERRQHFIWLEDKAANKRMDSLATEMKQVNEEIRNELIVAEHYKAKEADIEHLESVLKYIISLKEYKQWLFKQLKETGENIRWLRSKTK